LVADADGHRGRTDAAGTGVGLAVRGAVGAGYPAHRIVVMTMVWAAVSMK
jgi:hypothetical protein